MAIIIPDAGNRTLLNGIISDYPYYYHLYTVNVPLTQSTTKADLPEPVTFWYQPLLAENWSDAVTLGPVAVLYADPLVWTVGAVVTPVTIYGYWVSVGPMGNLLWCEAIPGAPIPMNADGDECAVFPRLSFRADPNSF